MLLNQTDKIIADDTRPQLLNITGLQKETEVLS
jgi:hypothetical protein